MNIFNILSCNNVSSITSDDWKKVEDKLSLTLPKDYKMFIEMYGCGCINNFIWILSPFTPNTNLNFFDKGEQMLNAYRQLNDNYPDEFRHKAYPENDGLLPWGITDNGDELYWVMTGNSDNWPIVVYESRSSDDIMYHYTMSDFLYKIAVGEDACELFPADLFANGVKFTAID